MQWMACFLRPLPLRIIFEWNLILQSSSSHNHKNKNKNNNKNNSVWSHKDVVFAARFCNAACSLMDFNFWKPSAARGINISCQNDQRKQRYITTFCHGLWLSCHVRFAVNSCSTPQVWQAEEVRNWGGGRIWVSVWCVCVRGERERERAHWAQCALHPQSPPVRRTVSSSAPPWLLSVSPAGFCSFLWWIHNGYQLSTALSAVWFDLKIERLHCSLREKVTGVMEYWKQCALWLINCKVLPANHRVTWESAQVFDLAQTLRDGVLLCHLLNNLRPQTVNLKEINLRPQMSQVRAERSRFRPGPLQRRLSAEAETLKYG